MKNQKTSVWESNTWRYPGKILLLQRSKEKNLSAPRQQREQAIYRTVVMKLSNKNFILQVIFVEMKTVDDM
jgi:hypothetical protein